MILEATAVANRLCGYRHMRGVHCATAALRNIFYHGTGTLLSESLIFGIGAGLHFTYVRFGAASTILTMGRGVDIEGMFADAMGLTVESTAFSDNGMAWEYAREQVEAGHPVMLDTDMFLLPYMLETIDPRLHHVHFGGHKVLLTGYDLEAGTAELADYAWQSSQNVSLGVLEQARGNPDCLSPPINRALVFHFPERVLPLPLAVRLGLERTRCLMRNSVSAYTGLKAIDRFCRQVTRWNRVLKEDFAENVLLAGHMMQRAGTGGGNFRRLHSRFLRECAGILKDERFEAVADIYAEAAARWTELAGLLEASEGDRDKGLYAANAHGDVLTQEIWGFESSGLSALETILNQPSKEVFA